MYSSLAIYLLFFFFLFFFLLLVPSSTLLTLSRESRREFISAIISYIQGRYRLRGVQLQERVQRANEGKEKKEKKENKFPTYITSRI
jgi:hypothetical protein